MTAAALPLVTALVGLVVALTGGCDRIAGGGCSEVGAVSGIFLELPRTGWSGGYRPGLEAEVRLCQGDQCRTDTGEVYRADVDGRTAATVRVPGFATSYDAGSAEVDVVVRDGTREVRRFETVPVELSRSWPNGRRCDGAGFLSGTADLRPDPARSPRGSR